MIRTNRLYLGFEEFPMQSMLKFVEIKYNPIRVKTIKKRLTNERHVKLWIIPTEINLNKNTLTILSFPHGNSLLRF